MHVYSKPINEATRTIGVMKQYNRVKCTTCGRFVAGDPLDHIREFHGGNGVVQPARGA